MGLLESVMQTKGTLTEWSAVFNLSDFSVDYVVNRNYTNIYHLTVKDF